MASNGNKVRALRKHLKMTQRELSERLGVSCAAVARWETDDLEIPKPCKLLLGILHRTDHRYDWNTLQNEVRRRYGI